jgi:light-regulated signal transduction histidine kinase (bacteriophytochrome)
VTQIAQAQWSDSEPSRPIDHVSRAGEARLRAELAASRAEMRQMLHAISHDLRAPLRAVLGFVELIQEPGLGSAERDSYFAFIREGAHSLQAMLSDLENYARIDSRGGPLDRTEMQAVVESVWSALQVEFAGKGAVLEISVLPSVRADSQQIALVWRHLVRNALTFCHGRPRLQIWGERRGAHIEYSVEDNGIGIAEPDRARVFELFTRLHAYGSYPGRGTGLAFARRIVERHHGRIWIETSELGGTALRFTLPADPELTDSVNEGAG